MKGQIISHIWLQMKKLPIFYSQLNHDEIQFSGIVDINTAGIDKFIT